MTILETNQILILKFNEQIRKNKRLSSLSLWSALLLLNIIDLDAFAKFVRIAKEVNKSNNFYYLYMMLEIY